MAVHSILSGTQWDGNTKGTLAEAYKYKIVLKPVGQQYIKAMHIIPHIWLYQLWPYKHLDTLIL